MAKKKRTNVKPPRSSVSRRAKTKAPRTRTPLRQTNGALFAHVDEVVWRRAKSGEIVVLDTRVQSGLYSIDGVAADAWLLFNGKRTLAQIEAMLAKRRRVVALASKFEKLVADLKRLKLIRRLD